MKNLFEKTEIAIDLTSLLDVIFIVLLIVMCNQKFTTSDAKDQLLQAETMVEEAERIETQYLQHMEKYEKTDEYVLFMDVTCTFKPSQISERTLTIMIGSSEEAARVYEKEITPVNAAEAYEEIQKYLDKKIDEYVMDMTGTTRPVILTVNRGDSDILYRDELAIEAVFERLKDIYDFVYVR